jgi:putative transposase
MKLWLTAAEIAAEALPELPATKRRVNAFAERHGWRDFSLKARRRAGAEGGGGWEYHIDLLPAWSRLAYFRKYVAIEEESWLPGRAEGGAPRLLVDPAVAGEAGAEALSAAALAQRDARLVIARMAGRHHKGSGLALVAADRLFCDLFNGGSMPVQPWVRQAVGSVSIRSLARWRAALKTGRTVALGVDRAAARKGTGVLDRIGNGELRATVLAALARNPLFTARHSRRS